MSKFFIIGISLIAFAIANAKPGKVVEVKKITTKKLPAKKVIVHNENSTDTQLKANAVVVAKKSESGSSTWNWIKPRLSVGGYVVTANSLDGDFKSATNAGTSEFSTSTGFGFQAQLTEFQKWDKLGFYANIAYEMEKDLSQLRLKSPVGTASGQLGSKFKTFLVGAGVNFSVTHFLYFPAGLNLPILTEVTKGQLESFSLTPRFGYQLGAGMKIQKNINAEILWRRLQFDGSIADSGATASLSNLKLEGLNLQATYKF